MKRIILLTVALMLFSSYPAYAGLISAYERYQGYKHSESKSAHALVEVERKFLNRHSTYRKVKHDYLLVTPQDEKKKKHDEEHIHELSKVKEDECKRLHLEYSFRHPPGTKPESSKGSHGCHLWKEDAHWHDEHPQVITILGNSFSLAF